MDPTINIDLGVYFLKSEERVWIGISVYSHVHPCIPINVLLGF